MPMSFLGIDVGTTGCKASVFSATGRSLAFAYDEYDMVRPRPGWLELDPVDVWARVRRTVAKAVQAASGDPVTALAVSSMGESMVPVSRDRRILGNSLLLIDSRGEEYLPLLSSRLGAEKLYRINGNILGIQFSLPKLMWIRDHTPDIYTGAWKFLLWSGFVSFMLGAEPAVDYSLANRTLLFDVDSLLWSKEVARHRRHRSRQTSGPRGCAGRASGAVSGADRGGAGSPAGHSDRCGHARPVRKCAWAAASSDRATA